MVPSKSANRKTGCSKPRYASYLGGKHAILTASVLSLVVVSSVWACNIPVFRYALERWKPDACEVVVFHDAPLNAEQNKILSSLTSPSEDRKSANIALLRAKTTDPNPSLQGLWLNLEKNGPISLPYVVVRTSVNDKQSVNAWHGPLSKFDVSKLVDSPVRKEISRRLLKGDSVVWLVLKSKDQQRSQATVELLRSELKKLSKTIPFPEGLGLPGSELYSELPLLMQFSVIEIDRDDRNEEFLVGLFRGFQPEAYAKGESLVVPVFGRGRALEVLPADQLDAGMIGDLTRYLCGACSCQVKERNPGFDLLLTTHWDRELFGDDGQLPPPPKEYDPNTAPSYVPIPGGNRRP